MKTPFTHLVEQWLRRSVPALSVLFFSLLSIVSVPAPDYALIAPRLTMMALFCWVVWRPQLMPYLLTFGIGLFEDLVRGTPFGATALLLLIAHGVARGQQERLESRGFESLWIGFCLVALATSVIEWIVMSVMVDDLIRPGPAVFHLLLTVLTFPIVYWLLGRLQRRALRPA